jgi:hypothetical protein
MGNFEDIFVVKSRGSVGYWFDPHDDLGASGTYQAGFSPHLYVNFCHHMLYIRRSSVASMG